MSWVTYAAIPALTFFWLAPLVLIATAIATPRISELRPAARRLVLGYWVALLLFEALFLAVWIPYASDVNRPSDVFWSFLAVHFLSPLYLLGAH